MTKTFAIAVALVLTVPLTAMACGASKVSAQAQTSSPITTAQATQSTTTEVK